VKPQWRIIKAVEFVDSKPQRESPRGVAIRMTPPPKRDCSGVIASCRRQTWLARPDVLEKAKLPGRFQRPTDFAECGAGSRSTQHQRGTAASNASSSTGSAGRDRNHSHPPARSQRLVRQARK
ncbi:hypothetical protein I553_3993, partial [Mycobacterium xenopi 4042]